jgi:hypothetical protein
VKLFLGWVDAILKHFMHTWIFSTKWAGSQAKSRSIPVPRPKQGTRLLSPWLQPGVLRRSLINKTWN